MDSLPSFMQSRIVESENFCQLANGEACILGIDEAGRGPTIGPMVYGCALTPLSKLTNLDSLGIDDSKKLDAKKRDSVYADLKTQNSIAFAWLAHSARYLTAHTLSLRNPQNLNEISHSCAASLVQHALDAGINIQEVVLDTVGPKDTYQAWMQSKFPNIKIVVEEKADGLYKIVGAASIVAKVNRDDLLENHVFDEIGMSRPIEGFGSGYVDDTTMNYLSNSFDPVFGYSTLVRFTWKNIDKAIQENGVKCKWVEPDAPQTMLAFFQKIGTEAEIPKCSFFKNKNVKHNLLVARNK